MEKVQLILQLHGYQRDESFLHLQSTQAEVACLCLSEIFLSPTPSENRSMTSTMKYAMGSTYIDAPKTTPCSPHRHRLYKENHFKYRKTGFFVTKLQFFKHCRKITREFYIYIGKTLNNYLGYISNSSCYDLIKVEIFLEQREVVFLSPSKICKTLNFPTKIQNFAG